MLDIREVDQAAMHRHLGGILMRTGGFYYATVPHSTASTNAALGNGTGRFGPWAVLRTTAFAKIGAEITSAGEAGSLLRLGIFADDGAGYPGALVLDAGTIAGDSVAVQEITVAFTLTPGLYWVGGVVQSAPTTQPTVRVVAQGNPSIMLTTNGATPTGALVRVGYTGSSMTGALPSTWPTATPNVSDVVARVFVKTA